MKFKQLAPNFFPALFLVSLLQESANAAKILFFMGLASHSHRVALQPFAAKLADAGHQVEFLTYTKAETPHENITEWFPESAREMLLSHTAEYGALSIQRRLKQKYYDPFRNPQEFFEMMLPGLETTILSAEFKEWVKNAHYDLIIYDNLLREVANAIAYKMGAKVIGFTTTSTQWMFDFDMYGLPVESSWLPDLSPGSEYPFIPHHFFYAYNALWWYFSYKWNYLPRVDEILRKLYGEELPPIEQLVRKTDLMFVNEHFTSTFPRSLPPFMIPIGGMHCKESKGILSKDLEAFLKTKERFVFISFGSAIRVSALPLETQKMLFDTVGSISDTNFLWKWEGEIPKNLPKNVLALNWFPQQDVLAHPKCKGFVTQGGVMSHQQGIFHGIPMIVVPIWGDQGYVANSVVYHGNGIYMEIADINKLTLTKSLQDILDNQRYSKVAKEMSRRFKDRPMAPADTAVWWTDYVLRHDTAHLKSPGIQQYWWQRRLLDFWGAVFAAVLLSVFTSCKVLGFLSRKIMGLHGNTAVQKDKQS